MGWPSLFPQGGGQGTIDQMTTLRTAYSDQLEMLARGGLVESRLAIWAAESGRPVSRWRRTHGRLYAGKSPWAVLVYVADDRSAVQVRLLDESSVGAGAPGTGWLPVGPLGWMHVLPCEADPRLPGLSAVLRHLEEPTVVRYRPGNRCTVRGLAPAGPCFVKVLADIVDDQGEARARWDAATSGALSFAVAEPLGWDERTRSSWYGVVPGHPLVDVLASPRGAEHGWRVGQALGELAVSALRPSRAVDATQQLARTHRGLARAAAAVPALAEDVRTVADALADIHRRLGGRRLAPSHGAAHLGQWLVDDRGRLGLVDFDRYALGEPEFDLATFFVELRAEPSLSSWAPDIEQAVLGAFSAVAGEPDHDRIQVYALHKELSRLARFATALRPDAGERAARHLRKLRKPLAELAG